MATYGTVDVWLDRVKDIALIIRQYAAETEEKRRLSRSVVDATLQAGLYSLQLATSHAIAGAAKTVDLVHATAGTSAICNEYEFQQYFRNVHTITQHAFASASHYESVGAGILGVESDWGSLAL